MVTTGYELEIAYRQQQVARDVRRARGTLVTTPRRPRRRLRLHLPAFGLARHRSV